jgi:hypothetical protein
MKRILLSLSSLLAFTCLFGQGFEKAPDGKVLINYVGTNDVGAKNNFKYLIEYGLNPYAMIQHKLKTINSSNVNNEGGEI